MKVDFYILESATQQQSLLFTSRLLEKKFAEAKRIYIYTNSEDESERLDKFFWTYQDDSFLPHEIYQANSDCFAPIQIGHIKPSTSALNILLNFQTEIPSFYREFSEVIEIISSNPDMQQLARERFKQYRDQGCEMHTHKIKASDV